MKYIKADDLIQFCTSMLVEAKDDEIIQTHNNCFRHMREHIKSLSAADVVEVKHGEWIDYDDDYGSLMCSICEKDAPNDIPWDFCPNCGADMRGITE